MSHRPIHQWKLNEQGRPMLDDRGERIPHRKQGQPKKPNEWTQEERKSIEAQERTFKVRARAYAAQMVGAMEKAKQTLADN